MNNTTKLEKQNWMLLLRQVLWNNTFKLEEKEKAAADKLERINIIREHVVGGISAENIAFLQSVANLFLYFELSAVFWYYPEDHQKSLLQALPGFDPFTMSEVNCFDFYPHEHVIEIARLRRNEFMLAYVDFIKTSEYLTVVMAGI